MSEYTASPHTDQHVIHDNRETFAMITESAFERWASKKLKPASLNVYIALIFRANSHTRSCFPSLKTIADDSGISRRGVVLALDQLKGAGLISITERKSANGQSSNIYTILATGYSVAGGSAQSAPGVVHRVHSPSAQSAPLTRLTELDEDEPYVVAPKRKQQPLRPIPDQFYPGDKLLDWCEDEGFTKQQVHQQVPQFIDHHTAKGTQMRDWSAAFRTWMRNAQKWGTLDRTNGNGNGNGQRPAPRYYEKDGSYTAEGALARMRGEIE
jgi:DNA-binding MarR family transcriptional regulator